MVERTINWLKGLRRMRVRHDLLAVMQDAISTLSAQVGMLIATDHTANDYEFVIRHSWLIVDTRNATAKAPDAGSKVVKA